MDNEKARELLQSAIVASELSARRFAIDVLDVDERTLRYWLAGERKMSGTILVVSKAIVIRPALAVDLVRAHEALVLDTG